MQRPLYFPAIDGLRLLAFLLVFFRHFKIAVPFPFLRETGWIGVELFFLISGFLLTKLLREEYIQQGTIQIKQFFARRALRVWPLYFFYLLVISLYAIKVGPHYFFPDRLIGNFLFYDNIISAIELYNPNSFTIHLWSISMEEQYYLLLPFAIPWLLSLDQKKLIRFFLFAYLIILAARLIAFVYKTPDPFIYVLPISGDCFLLGMMLGIGLFDNIIHRFRSLPTFVISVLLLSTIYFLPAREVQGFHNVYVYSIIAVAFALLLISVIHQPNKLLEFIFANKLSRYLGKISYGLYIYHIISIYGAGRICDKLGIAAQLHQLWLSLFLTVILSVLSYEFFEKFFLRYKYKFTVITSRLP